MIKDKDSHIDKLQQFEIIQQQLGDQLTKRKEGLQTSRPIMEESRSEIQE